MDTFFLNQASICSIYASQDFPTDNWAEFKNKLIKSYWEGKIIYFVNITLGYLQSQDAIEAFNKTVQNFLILAKDAQKDKFNLEHSIADFFMYYNKRKHTKTTKHSPIEIKSNVNDEKLLDDVREIHTKKTRKKMRALSSQKGRKYLSAIG